MTRPGGAGSPGSLLGAAGLESPRSAGRVGRLGRRARSSETARASGLAFATIINNAIQLVFTIVFTRLLGAGGYGSLAALVSALLILLVGGQALQVAAAREVALGHLGDAVATAGTLSRWIGRLLVATAATAVLAVLLRAQIADVVGVPGQAWAAAGIAPTVVLWLLLSLQRGVLQGMHRLYPVGASIVFEASGRLAFGLVLFAAGAGVTGAYLGSPLSIALTSLAVGVVLRRRLASGDLRPDEPAATAGAPELADDAAFGAVSAVAGAPALVGPPAGAGAMMPPASPTHATPRSLRGLMAGAWVPVLALTLLAVLQNVDVIVVRHQIGGSRAGSYAAAAVAAKAVVWVAIGVGLYLLPVAVRHAREGLDPRPVLVRALAILAAVATPALIIFALASHLVLRLAFGEHLAQASSALPILAAAMTLLAVSYLVVQYQLALGRRRFLVVLAGLAIAEPFMLSAGHPSLVGFAAIVLGVQAAVAAVMLGLGLRRPPALRT